MKQEIDCFSQLSEFVNEISRDLLQELCFDLLVWCIGQ